MKRFNSFLEVLGLFMVLLLKLLWVVLLFVAALVMLIFEIIFLPLTH